MSLRLAILCPGQGGQHAAMLDLLHNDTRAAGFLADCHLDTLLGAPLQDLLNDPQALFANANAQPLVVAAQLAAWTALADPLRAVVGAPTLVAGYSVGELSAAAVAGCFDPQATVTLAAGRAGLMDAAVHQAQGLMSVGALALADVARCLQRHGAFVAIVTGEETLIAGGLRSALADAALELVDLGARCAELPVALASHTPLMQPAQQPFRQLLGQISRAPSPTVLLAGITGEAVSDPGQHLDLLARQLVEPIQWAACMDACAEHGITVALELGPGAALSRMLRERHAHITSRSLSEFRSLDGVLRWLQQQSD